MRIENQTQVVATGSSLFILIEAVLEEVLWRLRTGRRIFKGQ
jgi:hypothetical protein